MAKTRTLDDGQREQIRCALIRYQKIHRIGAPELYQRMLAALNLAGVAESSFSQSTLQRFLAAKRNKAGKLIRTEDRAVLRYQKFLDIEAPPPPYEVMGEAVAAFFAQDNISEQRGAYHELTASSFAPRYRVYLKGEPRYINKDGESEPFALPDFPVPEEELFTDTYAIPYSIITTEILEGTPFLKVDEQVVNPTLTNIITDVEQMELPGSEFYEGMIAFSSIKDQCIMSLRHCISFFPRFYILFNSERKEGEVNSVLYGSCICVNEELMHHNPGQGFLVKLVPVLED